MPKKNTKKAAAPTDPYDDARDEIMESLELIPLVKGTTPQEYLDALKRIQEDVDNWFEASKDAAKEDIGRSAADD